MRDIPTEDHTDTPIRDSGVRAHASGAFVVVRGAGDRAIVLSHDQALTLAAELVSATNAVTRTCPGGAS